MSELRHENVSFCQIPGDLRHVSAAAKLLRDFCEQRLIDPIVWAQVELGFCEALNNAIEHGCQEDETRFVKALWKWEDDLLEIEIEDPGAWSANSEDAHLPENPLEESRRGCFIIDSVFDSATYSTCDYGHKLALKNSLHPPQNAVDKLQETYESLLATNGDLHSSYARGAAIQELANNLAHSDSPDTFIKQSVKRLRSVVELPHIEVWTLRGNVLANRFHDAPSDLENEIFSIESLRSSTFGEVLDRKTGATIEGCASLPISDPTYSKFEHATLEPIIYQTQTFGLVAIRSNESNAEIADLSKTLAQFIAISLANDSTFSRQIASERSETQLDVASEIQRSLLPSSFPENQHCRLTGKCVTALAVGGDYIDAIEIRGQGLLLIIADVMGKGVPAALLATIFRTAIRSRLNLAETPGWLLSQINKQIYEELGHLNMFITAQAAYFSYGDKSLKLSSSGHCPAFLMKSGQSESEELNAEGIPLGISPSDIYEERIVELATGDRVLFITDGIYETHDEAGNMLGIDAFAKRLPEIWRDGLYAVPDKALAVTASHNPQSAPEDDKTLMALEVL